MHDLTKESIEKVFEFLAREPLPERRAALLAWLPGLSQDPLGAAGYELTDGTLFARIPGSDIRVWYRILESPRGISITGVS